MKLADKTRIGSKVIKKHDPPTTPFQRVLNHPSIPDDRKRTLKEQYLQLNPTQIERTMVQLQERLFTLAEPKLIRKKTFQDAFT